MIEVYLSDPLGIICHNRSSVGNEGVPEYMIAGASQIMNT